MVTHVIRLSHLAVILSVVTMVMPTSEGKLGLIDILQHVVNNKFTWQNCGDPVTQSFNITMFPNPPVRGEDFQVSIEFVPDADLTNGKVDLDFWHDYRPAFAIPYPICKTGTKEEHCPMRRGVLERIQSKLMVLPMYIESGHYNATATMVNQSGHQMLCATMEGDIQ
ncbi:phosphatidylglycerol/phosphatidylinositol transfer protein-like [Branchiostoma floridae]|uniref:Phosphatidylglycerol/phosphatidylinositol transfer protein-like n=1 Tax=Branchiostoma floridae TaxID=7739 RepID=A0A9J7M3U3_BRAFL|nr:phosphatidylglycerol/phosphatidylinositol transfer protein-like [Branchiostoma floridae]XP_035693967.1 phosphatidylglycerol/phosphatidylinositol transfer protein-like [Branchiostoma floridae]